jgi:hypothetical protein
MEYGHTSQMSEPAGGSQGASLPALGEDLGRSELTAE